MIESIQTRSGPFLMAGEEALGVQTLYFRELCLTTTPNQEEELIDLREALRVSVSQDHAHHFVIQLAHRRRSPEAFMHSHESSLLTLW